LSKPTKIFGKIQAFFLESKLLLGFVFLLCISALVEDWDISKKCGSRTVKDTCVQGTNAYTREGS